MSSSARVVTILGMTWVVFLSAVYLPDLGRGFVKDDFAWIKTSRVRSRCARSSASTPPAQLPMQTRLMFVPPELAEIVRCVGARTHRKLVLPPIHGEASGPVMP